MPRQKVKTAPDADVLALLEILESYKEAHPRAEVAAYRQNSACIRIRIIDPAFKKWDRADRHDRIWELFDGLPDDIVSQITILLLLTPDETKTSIANMDFENPIPSRL